MKKSSVLKKIFAISNSLLLLAFLGFAGKTAYDFYAKSKNAIEDGKQVSIITATGEIAIRQTKEKIENLPENSDPNSSEKNNGSEVSSKTDNNNSEPANNNSGAAATPASEDNAPKLAIIIGNLGLNKAVTEEVLKLPQEITLSFSPYANDVNNMVEAAVKNGHETLLDLPMETDDYPLTDPGPLALLSSSGKAKNLFRIKTILSFTNKNIGLLTPVNENFTNSLVNILPVIDELKNNKMLLIYNEKASNEFVKEEARSVGLPVIPSYIVVDDVQTKEVIDKKLAEAAKIATDERKPVLLIAHPYPVTIEQIAIWLQEYQKDGKKIFPVSKLAVN